jgi:hypothetical protein
VGVWGWGVVWFVTHVPCRSTGGRELIWRLVWSSACLTVPPCVVVSSTAAGQAIVWAAMDFTS